MCGGCGAFRLICRLSVAVSELVGGSGVVVSLMVHRFYLTKKKVYLMGGKLCDRQPKQEGNFIKSVSCGGALVHRRRSDAGCSSGIGCSSNRRVYAVLHGITV